MLKKSTICSSTITEKAIFPTPLFANKSKFFPKERATGSKILNVTKSDRADKIIGPTTFHNSANECLIFINTSEPHLLGVCQV